jgi:aquaporin Z
MADEAAQPLLPSKVECLGEEGASAPSILSRLVVEFIGAFFLILTVYLTVAQAAPEAPLAIGTVLAVMILMGGHVSGAHYNPAVTLAVVLSGRNDKLLFAPAGSDWKRISLMTGAYIGTQCFAGIVAAAIGFGLTGVQWGPAPGAKYGIGQALGAEILFTFGLAYIVLNVATSDANANNHFYGFAIGLLVFVGATAAGEISGAVFNPAVGTGITMMDVFLGGSLSNIWIYWLGPMTGGALAAGVFRLQNPTEYTKEE